MTQPQPVSLGKLAELISASVVGNSAHLITGVGSLADGSSEHLGFFHDPKRKAELANTALGGVILAPANSGLFAGNKLIHANPHVAFAKLATYLYPEHKPQGIHPTAVVDPSAELHPSVHVGAGAVIGAHCLLAAGVVIEPRVVLYADVHLGENCHVHAGAVIGATGFGYANAGGQWLSVPQVGGVRIGANVDIGANTTIDRGAIGHTIIDEGVKLDNQIQIGHNCHIGAHTAIAGCVGIAGSASIGKYCMIGGAAMISGHLSICDKVVISGGTLVASNITEPGQYTGVFPTIPHKAWAKLAGTLRHQSKK